MKQTLFTKCRKNSAMKPTPSRRTLRIEKKKKKMAAFLEISRLNELDRANLNKKSKTDNGTLDNATIIESEPSPKRFCNNVETTDEAIVKNNNDKDKNLTPSGKPLLEGEEFKQLKAALRLKTKKLRSQPVFRLREAGDNACISVDISDRVPLFVSDIQHLLLYCVLGHHSPYSPARWCQLERFPKVQQTNVLIIDNISLYHYHAYESCFPFLSSSFQHKLEVVAPFAYKGDIVTDLLMVPLTTTQVRKYVNEFGTLEAAVSKSEEVFDQIKDLFPIQEHTSNGLDGLPATDKFPRTHLLLSGWQMVEENFPLPIKGLMDTKYAGYVLTKDEYKDVTPFSPMFGLDCEMCRTTSGDLELTRISIVDEDHKVFYEELVKPDNRIVDYLTQFSGITPKMMKNVTKRLQDVQKDLRNLLPPDAILVGQSLGNDMHAMKMMHPYVIDSSVIFNLTGDRTRKSKLQLLAREFLSQRIQQGRGGHCSIEDSKASLELVQLKLQNDLFFGDAVMNGLSAQKHPQLGHPYFATSFFKQIARASKPVSVISLPDLTEKYRYFLNKGKDNIDDQSKVTIYSSDGNETVIQECIEKGSNAFMNITHIRVNRSDLEKEPETILRQLDTWIKDCYEATFAPSLSFVIFGGQRESGNGSCFIKMKNSF